MNWRHVDCPTQTSIRLGLYENGVLKAIAIGANRIEHDWTLTPKRSQANFAYYARRALANHPDALDR